MIDDPNELRHLLRGTMLDGCPIEANPIDESDQVSFELLLDEGPGGPVSWQDAWPVARELVPGTGRWPIAFGYLAEPYSRRSFGPEGSPRSPVDVLGARRVLTHHEAVERVWQRDLIAFAEVPDAWSVNIEGQLTHTRFAVGRVPPADLLDGIAAGDFRTVERRLLAWEQSSGIPVPPEPPEEASGWGDHVNPGTMLFLPTDNPADTLAYVHYYGGGGTVEDQAAFIAIVDGWQETYGAELQSNSSQTLEFAVERPPSNVIDAFDLATQLAPYSTTHTSTMRNLARALVDNTHWQLYLRP